jgi:hypothetical protein
MIGSIDDMKRLTKFELIETCLRLDRQLKKHMLKRIDIEKEFEISYGSKIDKLQLIIIEKNKEIKEIEEEVNLLNDKLNNVLDGID